ncbi:MAG: TOBE domain-containing protein [Thermoplasmata archaeon]
MTHRPNIVTTTDVALLRALAGERSVVAASRTLGISRDRAVYRLRRLERAFGGPVVRSERGGTRHGGTRLTELGDRIIRQGFDSVELLDSQPLQSPSRSNLLRGVYERSPSPAVRIDPHLRLSVSFSAEEGEPVAVLLDPESIVVARRSFPSSARNCIPGTVERVEERRGSSSSAVRVRSGSVQLTIAVTPESVRLLRLRPGANVVLLVKATALRRVGAPTAGAIRGSLRS